MTLNCFDALEGLFVNEEEGTIEQIDKTKYRNHSKKIAWTIGFLLGVKDEFLRQLVEYDEEYTELEEKLQKNEYALAIRTLCNIRSNLILSFKAVSRGTRLSSADYKPLYQMDQFKDDFRILGRLEISLYVNGNDINEYLRKINTEIQKRIDQIRPLFPDWVKFSHIRFMFIMPKNVEEESKKFQANQNFYPYKRYFNWVYPEESGNILLTDERILTLLYHNDGDTFQDSQRVVDASDHVKNSISDFISRGEKVQIFVDGENISPYTFASALESLKEHEIRKIDKIVVYCDKVHSPRAWKMLGHFSDGIEVEIIAVERIMEDKSLVDHKLVAGVSKAYYKDGVDSFILASSDSDFWSVIEDTEANFLVMVEKDSCSANFKEVMRSNNVFYCYLDSFQTPEEDRLFHAVVRGELREQVEQSFVFPNARQMLGRAIFESRAEVSNGAFESLYAKYIKGMTFHIDKDGTISVELPEI